MSWDDDENDIFCQHRPIPPAPPKPPLCRMIKEGYPTGCPKCGSSRKWIGFWNKRKCVHIGCGHEF